MLSFMVVLLAVAASVQAKCDTGCAVPVTAYEEMGCEPVFAKPTDCCPSHYNCAKFDARSSDKCYVRGQVYDKGDSIDSSVTGANCLAACYCSKSEWQDITCAHIDCPEFLGGGRLEPGCLRTYDSDQCCSKGTICPPFDKLEKCEVEGKTYYEGQRFYPKGDKLNCVCKSGFKGKYEAPFCSEINCGTEILNSQNFKNKCAPVFYGSKGCPIQWECLKDGDVIVPNKEKSTSDQKCNYGSKQLNIGDKVLLNKSASSPKINCDCKIPPLVTCIQTPYDS